MSGFWQAGDDALLIIAWYPLWGPILAAITAWAIHRTRRAPAPTHTADERRYDAALELQRAIDAYRDMRPGTDRHALDTCYRIWPDAADHIKGDH
jgi:hypothetical protein